jgi:hypothetical protein
MFAETSGLIVYITSSEIFLFVILLNAPLDNVIVGVLVAMAGMYKPSSIRLSVPYQFARVASLIKDGDSTGVHSNDSVLSPDPVKNSNSFETPFINADTAELTIKDGRFVYFFVDES